MRLRRKSSVGKDDLSSVKVSSTSDADLTGANLIGTNYDASTILNCVGHPICETG